eukprot:4524357-Pleurochrysis_carterae.AAC.1
MLSGVSVGGARSPSRPAAARSAGVPSPSRMKHSHRRCCRSVAVGVLCCWPAGAVSYTHLTLPTILLV